jgi:hypothetical protein
MSSFKKYTDFIEYANMRFHSDTASYPVQIFPDADLNAELDYKFGIVDMRMANSIPITTQHLHIFCTIDSSASMSDIGSDGMTKISHIHHTLENMLRHFHGNHECDVSIYLQTFDTVIKPIITDVANIRDADIEELTKRIHNITPDGSTNIELALYTASCNIASYKVANPKHEIVHLFLTDGDITKGAIDHNVLFGWVPKCCTNIFIGYGIHHNAQLLSRLSNNKGDEYKFIDALENAPLVYGEIIHSMLYKAIENATVTATNGELYDYKTNSWTSELSVGNLLGEQVKTYHIRTKNPEDCNVSVTGINIIRFRQKCKQYERPVGCSDEYLILYTTDDLITIPITCTTTVDNLDVYILRQKTQELLYKARHTYTNNNSLVDVKQTDELLVEETKRELSEFHKQLLTYMKETHLDNEPILKMCCDDIYIAYMTMGTVVGEMFTCARQTSNGQQQSYMCSQIQSPALSPSHLRISPPKLQRQVADPGMDYWFPMPEILSQIDYNVRPTTPVSPLIINRTTNIVDDNDICNYVPSQDFISPFVSSKLGSLMRDLSNA